MPDPALAGHGTRAGVLRRYGDRLPPTPATPLISLAQGKLAQAVAHGAKILDVKGNFDDALKIARRISEEHPVALVNSVNPYRIEGQKTAAFEIVDVLGDAPDLLFIPVGNAGN